MVAFNGSFCQRIVIDLGSVVYCGGSTFTFTLLMEQTKTKRSAKKRPAGHSPIPMGPGSVCGHSACVGNCRVRYAGPTSHPRDHYIQMAAHGTKHIWMASIVAGLAAVLTGAIAYTAVQAESAPRVTTLQQAVSVLSGRLDRIERKLDQVLERLPEKAKTAPNKPAPKPDTACVAQCEQAAKTCRTEAGAGTISETTEDALKVCLTARTTCLRACIVTQTTSSGEAPAGTQ